VNASNLLKRALIKVSSKTGYLTGKVIRTAREISSSGKNWKDKARRKKKKPIKWFRD